MAARSVWLVAAAVCAGAPLLVTAQEPKTAAEFNKRGVGSYDKKEYDKAIADYTEAIRLDPSNPQAFEDRGRIWRAKGDSDKANKDFAEAKRLREMKK